MVGVGRLHIEKSLLFSGVEAKIWEKVLEKHVLFKKSFENELGFQNKNHHKFTCHLIRLLVCVASGSALSPERSVRKGRLRQTDRHELKFGGVSGFRKPHRQ